MIRKLIHKWQNRKLIKFLKEKEKMGSVYIKTRHAPWVSYKTFEASATALGVTERKGANVPADAYNIPEMMNNMEVRASADGGDGDECTASFYGARWKDKQHQTYDDVSLIGTANLTTGLQIATDLNNYVDTIVPTDRWITEIHIADAKGNNGMARIAFDTSGYDVFFMSLNYAGAENWKVQVSGW